MAVDDVTNSSTCFDDELEALPLLALPDGFEVIRVVVARENCEVSAGLAYSYCVGPVLQYRRCSGSTLSLAYVPLGLVGRLQPFNFQHATATRWCFT